MILDLRRPDRMLKIWKEVLTKQFRLEMYMFIGDGPDVNSI